MTSTPHVFDVTLANFESEVIGRSSQTPVLVDFWATWSEPCKDFLAALEELAEACDGAFLLGKCEVDANPDLAQAFRVQSVPTAVLIVDGRPLDAFAGALPRAEVLKFLEAHLGSLGGPSSPTAAALELEEAGDLQAARALLDPWLAEHQDDATARIALARVVLAMGESEEAKAIFEALTEEQAQSAEGRAVAARFSLLDSAGDLEILRAELAADAGDVSKRVEYGKALVAAGEVEEGLEELLTAAKWDVHHDQDAPRKALIAVFQALGSADPLTLEFQQRLSVLLCS